MNASTNFAFLSPRQDGVVCAIKLQPRASRTQVSGTIGAELRVSVTAPPVDSAANEALLNFLADLFQRPRSSLRLIRGQTSRHKLVLVTGVDLKTAAARLQQQLT